MTKQIILIAEDDDPTNKLYKSLLHDHYSLHITENVRGARDFLADTRVDLAIVDLSLADSEDGLALIGYLREEYREPTIPILVITAHAYEADRIKSIAAGCDEFITKPVSGKEIIETIEKYLPK